MSDTFDPPSGFFNRFKKKDPNGELEDALTKQKSKGRFWDKKKKRRVSHGIDPENYQDNEDQ